jgi:predicted DNA-binding protein
MPNKHKEGTVPTSFWLDEETRVMLQDLSERMGMTRSGVIRQAIKIMHSDASSTEIRRLIRELAKLVGP